MKPIKINCVDCYACCLGLSVEVLPEDEDLWEELGILEEILKETLPNPYRCQKYAPNLILKQRDDGSCIFLVDGLCSIYEIRPRVCRDFEYLGQHCLRIRTSAGLEEN